jgi:phage-related tail fiber protein
MHDQHRSNLMGVKLAAASGGSIELVPTNTASTFTVTVPAVTGTLALTTQLLPAGTIIWFGASTAPTGYLKANGAAVSRTTYADLFTAIGTTFGVGDGSTTFNVPDGRGEFFRGWDDGRGVDSGRAFGSTQTDVIKNHTHTLNAAICDDGGVVYNVSGGGRGSAVYATGNNSSGSSVETRPRNLALLACIKF